MYGNDYFQIKRRHVIFFFQFFIKILENKHVFNALMRIEFFAK